MRVGRVSRPRRGEDVCGDQTLVTEVGTSTLIAVVDGLGHGPEAAEAANAACDAVGQRASSTLIETLFHCDRMLRATRGAAVTLLRLDPEAGVLSHAAVGNVQVTARAREPISVIATPGVVGARFRRVAETSHRFWPGDIIAIYTDGITPELASDELERGDPQATAERILERHGLERDDATCVVVAC